MHLVVGDVHGCYKAFKRLLKKSNFRPGKDKLWLTGDLVNRGPKSANVIRYVMDLEDQAKTVLGNHDLHLLAVAEGIAKPKRGDNSHKLLEQSDAPQMIDWLASRPLALLNKKHDFLLVHAAVHKDWTAKDTITHAAEIESSLQGENRNKFLKRMYGSKPSNWSDNLKKWDRQRLITNVLTRARFCRSTGSLTLAQKGPPGSQPKSFYPWFNVPNRKTANQMIIFGHWSALGYYRGENVICLDSGYLWGGKLTAMKLKKNYSDIIQISHD